MKIDVHENVCTPQIKTVVPISLWLSEIKEAKKYGPTIELARKHGKGSKEYVQIKTYKLPAVNFNYQFNEKLCLANAMAPTGVFYVDIDLGSKQEAQSYKESLRANQYVLSSWLSLSELGLGVLVRSSIVTPENFSELHRQFCEQFNIPFDKRAVKLNQYNVLSHDPNIYVNPNALEFNPVIEGLERNEKKKVQSLVNQGEKNKNIHIATNCTFLRYNNLNDFWKQGDVVTNEAGFEVTELFLPERIESGKRKHTLLAFANNLLYLNPNATPEIIYNQLAKKNERCTPPLPASEVWDVVQAVLKYQQDGSLKPIRTRTRKIIFGPDCGMDKDEKRQFVNQQIGKWKKNKTKRRIYEVLEDWNILLYGKITAKSVSEKSGLSLRTVKTYWSEFKDYVSSLNQTNMKKEPIELQINNWTIPESLTRAMNKLQNKIIELRDGQPEGHELVFEFVWAA